MVRKISRGCSATAHTTLWQSSTTTNSPPIPVPQMTLGDPVKEIRKRGAKEFRRGKEDDPIATGNRLLRVLWVTEELQCTPPNSLRCAVSLLEDEAY